MPSYLPPQTDPQLEWYMRDEKRTCLLFIKYKMFTRQSICNRSNCGSMSNIVKNTKDWHHNKYRFISLSMYISFVTYTFHRTGTIYEGSPLPLSTHLRILYKYKYGVSVTQASKQLKGSASKPTVVEYYKKYRSCLGFAVQNYYQDNSNRLGQHQVLEIDESKFNAKAKHRRGRQLAEQDSWVFGLVERNTGRCFLISVPDRSSETLIPIIRRIANPGATIVSDQWRGYLSLGDEGFVHITVNHSVQFVDPLTGEHSNTIEGLWARAKEKIKVMHGVQRQWAQSYLNEFMFRTLFGNSEHGTLAEMMVAIAKYQSNL